MKILFVCASNMCRSPYAEYMFKKIVAENPVLSANIEGISSTALFNKSKTMHPKTVKALLAEGISQEEIDSFKPDFKWCNTSKLKEADIIIGMSGIMRILLPLRYWRKYKTLSQASIDKCASIPDPWLSKSDEFYYNTMEMIKTFLYVYSDRLISEFSKNNQ